MLNTVKTTKQDFLLKYISSRMHDVEGFIRTLQGFAELRSFKIITKKEIAGDGFTAIGVTTKTSIP